jgi:hypothetical protein
MTSFNKGDKPGIPCPYCRSETIIEDCKKDSKYECPICMEESDDTIICVFACSHAICQTCVEEMIKTKTEYVTSDDDGFVISRDENGNYLFLSYDHQIRVFNNDFAYTYGNTFMHENSEVQWVINTNYEDHLQLVDITTGRFWVGTSQPPSIFDDIKVEQILLNNGETPWECTHLI